MSEGVNDFVTTRQYISHIYKAFHIFEELKLVVLVWILGSSQFQLLAQLPQKNDACFKSGQKRLENDHLGLSV